MGVTTYHLSTRYPVTEPRFGGGELQVFLGKTPFRSIVKLTATVLLLTEHGVFITRHVVCTLGTCVKAKRCVQTLLRISQIAPLQGDRDPVQ